MNIKVQYLSGGLHGTGRVEVRCYPEPTYPLLVTYTIEPAYSDLRGKWAMVVGISDSHTTELDEYDFVVPCECNGLTEYLEYLEAEVARITIDGETYWENPRLVQEDEVDVCLYAIDGKGEE